jgi:HAD superfamily hydrolase (TIGR01450 family)
LIFTFQHKKGIPKSTTSTLELDECLVPLAVCEQLVFCPEQSLSYLYKYLQHPSVKSAQIIRQVDTTQLPSLIRGTYIFNRYLQIPYEEEYMNSKPAQAKASPQTKMPPQANNQQTSSSEPHLPKMGRSGKFLSLMNPFKPKEIPAPTNYSNYFVTKARLVNDAMHIKFVLARKPVIVHPKREDSETCGFVFGVDEAFTDAHSSINLLQECNIPFVFLTNGSEATEKDCITELGKKFHVDNLDESQFIQASTPFKALVPQYKDKNILVIGAGAREVARAYGFKNVLTGADIHSVHHGTTFSEITCSFYQGYGSDSNDYILNTDGKLQISAIFIFSDLDSQSRDFDLQLITDLLLSSKGVIGSVSEWNGQDSFPNRGYGQDDQPAIYFSNSNSAFKTALEDFWARKTENARFPQVGKPPRSMFELANQSLQAQNQKINGTDAKEMKKIYMVTSTFSTEMMKGANDLNWTTILLRRNGEPTPDSSPRCAPSISIRGGLQDAIKYAMPAPSIGLKFNCKFTVGASESEEEESFEISKQDLGPEFSFGPKRESFETIGSESSVDLKKAESSASSAPDKSDEEEKRELVHELELIPHVSGDWPPMLTGAQEME